LFAGLLSQSLSILRPYTDPLKLNNLTEYHIWGSEHVAKYSSDSKVEAAYVWILKVYRLPDPKIIKPGRWYFSLPEPIPTFGSLLVLNYDTFISILERIKNTLEASTIEKPTLKPIENVPSHDGIRDMIWGIGSYEGKISEKDYPIDNYQIDVIWKRIKADNPSHAFGVHIGGTSSRH